VVTGSVIGASAPSAELATKSGTIHPVTDGENCGRSRKYSPRYWASNSGQLAVSIRPVVSPAYSGQLHHPPRGLASNSRRESIRPVNTMRRRPVIGAAKSGQLPGKPTSAPWSRSVFLGSIRPEIGQPIRGARESTIRPAIAVAKAPQCPQSVDALLPALLAPRYRTISHNPARVWAVYIRTRQPVNTEGNCNREWARAGITLRRSVASDGTVPLTGQLRPHWRSVKSVGNTVKSH
jgi:hypothetical protein